MSDAPQQSVSEAFDGLLAGIAALPDSLTIPIEPPIAFQGANYTQIVLREPKIDHVRQAQEQLRSGQNIPHNETNYRMHLVSKVAGVPFPVVQQMGVSRINAAMAFLNLFMFAGLGTGSI